MWCLLQLPHVWVLALTDISSSHLSSAAELGTCEGGVHCVSGCNAATIPWIRVFSIPMSVDVLGGLRLALGKGVALWQLCTIFAVLLGPLAA